MAQPRLKELATLIERQTGADGEHETAMAELTLTRLSAPSGPTAVLYEPSVCLVAQGSKQVLLAGDVYRYDSAWLLLVSVDLSSPISAIPSDRVLELGTRIEF